MKILFIGDIVGRVGRDIVKRKLKHFVEKYDIDFVIANGENATHGKGLIRRHYDELIDSGVDCITLGNHYDSKNELATYIDTVENLIRPINILRDYPGTGTVTFMVNGISLRVINVLGNAFMREEVSSPYLAIQEVLKNEKAQINIIDFHGESTSEKQCFGYVVDGEVTALLGTHTHVQTRDAHILPKGTAFISDVGMCGSKESVIGFEKESVVQKIIFGSSNKFVLSENDHGLFSAVVLNVDETNGLCKEIFAIYYQEDEK